jgi:hypothetical protein
MPALYPGSKRCWYLQQQQQQQEQHTSRKVGAHITCRVIHNKLLAALAHQLSYASAKISQDDVVQLVFVLHATVYAPAPCSRHVLPFASCALYSDTYTPAEPTCLLHACNQGPARPAAYLYTLLLDQPPGHHAAAAAAPCLCR